MSDGTRVWAIPATTPGRWRLIAGTRSGAAYSEQIMTGGVPAGLALSLLRQIHKSAEETHR